MHHVKLLINTPTVATIFVTMASYIDLLKDWLAVVSILIVIGYNIWKWVTEYRKENKKKGSK